MARAWTSQLYLYQREIQAGGPVRLEDSDSEEQPEKSGKKDEEENIYMLFASW